MSERELRRDVAIVWEVPCHLGAALANSTDFLPALAHVNPWRSSVVAAFSILTVAAIWDYAETPIPFFAAWLLPIVVFGLELATHRAYVTPDDLVIENGPFLQRRRVYPLRQIRRVEYDRGGFMGMLDVGNIDVQGEGWSVTLVSVKKP